MKFYGADTSFTSMGYHQLLDQSVSCLFKIDSLCVEPVVR